ncbi:hypothetical protein [Alkalicoccobacillus plakortidis]|uniref:Uncharacterized protein n=1 Tax=Alkalicoccobacillus plakortidis TaxID=444060 RepID=A0ABT0XQS4_9BACI|nr:hypothetical protein [Alkalicoccobacillus plakortidis]MCM2677637.1 hypothetical protein [Alkalicoccobacillus plakortidis]
MPLIIVSVIVVFVIKRLEFKYKRGTLGKKNSKSAQQLLDSLIPLGMLVGSSSGVFISLFFQISLLSAMTVGPGLGMLLGYIAYEIYSKTEEVSS